MAQSNSSTLHVAIIMDGNGRWANARGMSRSAGHRAGAEAVRRVVRAAAELELSHLTLFALSSANLQRPHAELDAIFELLREFLAREMDECARESIRLTVVGRRDRLPDGLVAAIGQAEERTARGTRLCLRLAIDYSAREAIVRAARRFHVESARNGAREGFGQLLAWEHGSDVEVPDVDLLIRTGGEQRLSDFLLWECAWAELLFTSKAWPEFDGAALRWALRTYRERERRFGGLPAQDSHTPTREQRRRA